MGDEVDNFRPLKLKLFFAVNKPDRVATEAGKARKSGKGTFSGKPAGKPAGKQYTFFLCGLEKYYFLFKPFGFSIKPLIAFCKV